MRGCVQARVVVIGPVRTIEDVGASSESAVGAGWHSRCRQICGSGYGLCLPPELANGLEAVDLDLAAHEVHEVRVALDALALFGLGVAHRSKICSENLDAGVMDLRLC